MSTLPARIGQAATDLETHLDTAALVCTDPDQQRDLPRLTGKMRCWALDIGDMLDERTPLTLLPQVIEVTARDLAVRINAGLMV